MDVNVESKLHDKLQKKERNLVVASLNIHEKKNLYSLKNCGNSRAFFSRH